MPGRRVEMRKLKEVLRLRLTAGLSNRKIATCTGIGKTAVSKHVARAQELDDLRVPGPTFLAIFDETATHHIKSPKSSALAPICNNAKRRSHEIVISGTHVK